MPTKAPKIYSTDPEALRRANPATLTEAQRAYRQLLLQQDTKRIVRGSETPEYLVELGNLISRQGNDALSPERREPTSEQTRSKPASANEKHIEKDIFSDE